MNYVKITCMQINIKFYQEYIRMDRITPKTLPSHGAVTHDELSSLNQTQALNFPTRINIFI